MAEGPQLKRELPGPEFSERYWKCYLCRLEGGRQGGGKAPRIYCLEHV